MAHPGLSHREHDVSHTHAHKHARTLRCYITSIVSVHRKPHREQPPTQMKFERGHIGITVSEVGRCQNGGNKQFKLTATKYVHMINIKAICSPIPFCSLGFVVCSVMCPLTSMSMLQEYIAYTPSAIDLVSYISKISAEKPQLCY